MNPSRPKDRFTVVPWMNPEEFKKVYIYLYSDSLSKKRWALDTIAVWSTRCSPSLPTAVEVTDHLVRATIQDMLFQAEKSLMQEKDIRMMYNSAIIRFVSLILEHHQNAAKKIPMSVLADKQNLPGWLVDLRNEGCHEFFPSLSMLRLGAEASLQYLEKNYWSVEFKNMKLKINVPSEKESEIAAILNEYKSLQFQRVESTELSRSLSKDMKSILKKIAVLIRQEKQKFLDVFVQPGNFIAAEDVTRLISETGPFLAEDNNLCLPENMQSFWLPLLRKIHQNELIPTFLEKLLLAQENCKNRICQKTAIAWAQLIFLGANSKSLIAKIFQKKGMNLNLPCLLYCCMKGTTPYSFELLTTLVGKCKKKKDYNCLFYLMAIYQRRLLREDSSSKAKTDPEQEIVFTVEDAEAEFKEIEAEEMGSDEEENIWYYPPVSMDFSEIPIGAVLNPVSKDNEESKEDSWKDEIKLGPSVDDNFIINDENSEEIVVDMEIDITETPSIKPEHFDMLYRRRTKRNC